MVKKVLLLILMLVAFSPLAQARNPFVDSLMKRGEVKKKSRWTLADWLDTKQRVRLMDHWLAMNTSAHVFEAVIGGAQASYDYTLASTGSEAVTKQKYTLGSLSAFVTIFGIEGLYQSSDERYDVTSLMFLLRLLGTSNQATNLTLHFGQRTMLDEVTVDEFENQMGGASLTLYLFKGFGIEGLYRVYLPGTSKLGVDLKGSLTEGGAFLEWGLIRLYGKWFREPLEISSSGIASTRTRQGLETGLKLFF